MHLPANGGTAQDGTDSSPYNDRAYSYIDTFDGNEYYDYNEVTAHSMDI
jgi:hypothetical protein